MEKIPSHLLAVSRHNKQLATMIAYKKTSSALEDPPMGFRASLVNRRTIAARLINVFQIWERSWLRSTGKKKHRAGAPPTFRLLFEGTREVL
jgi:hypothetical protein